MTPTTETPRVSVVIPAYNAAWCVGRAIDSALGQSFQDFELIVVDDGSRDDTPGVLARYGTALRVVRKANGGMSHARNAGIALARAPLIAFLDADDRWLPEKLQRQVECMDARPELAFCAATARLESPEGTHLGEWACRSGASPTVAGILGNHATVAGGASSVLARTTLVKALGGFDDALRGAEDTDLWIRLAAQGPFECIPDPLVVVLKRPDSVSRSRAAMRRGALAMTRKNRPLLPPDQRGGFWRSLYAGVLCDYAKWAYRDGHRIEALRDLAAAGLTSPLGRGRLVAGLLLAMLRGQRV